MTYLNNIPLPILMGILVTSIIFVMAVIFTVRYLRKTSDTRKTVATIEKYSEAFERNVILSDGLDGFFFIDYLIPLPGRIIVLNIHKAEGYVFGGERIEQWTQVVGNKTIKFKNPLEGVNLFVQQASNQVKFDDIMACVLFGSKSEFPKGVPEGVLQLESFEESLSALAEEMPSTGATSKAWEKLSALVAESRESYNKEIG